jgi:signal transduction histidine kinase
MFDETLSKRPLLVAKVATQETGVSWFYAGSKHVFSFLGKLLQPAQGIGFQEDSYARMTLGLTLICFLTSFVSAAYQFYLGTGGQYYATSAIFILVILFMIARTSYYWIAAWLLSSLAYLILSTSFLQGPPTDIATIMYSMIGFFIASLVLVPKHFYIFLSGSIAWYVIVFSIYSEPLHVLDELQTVIVIVVLLALVLMTSLLRFFHLNQLAAQLRLLEKVAEVAKISAEEAVQAREEAVKANETKSAFLASVSHELRTPLNAIIGFSGVILGGKLGDLNTQQTIYTERVLQNGKHLLNLINDVLDISKIASGSLSLYLQKDMDLKTVFEGLEQIAVTLIADKPIALEFKFNEVPKAMLDRQRIYQIGLNLVSNACKFCASGTIEFKLDYLAETEQLRFQVKDTGIGIAKEEKDKIFQAFEQSTSGLRLGGTGLGMPISRALAEGHGGELFFESEPGIGTTFTCLLPLIPPSHVVEKYFIDGESKGF